MSSVKVGSLGKPMQEVTASTVAEAIRAFGLEGNYSVTVNGAQADLGKVLNGGEILFIGEKVKGGRV